MLTPHSEAGPTSATFASQSFWQTAAPQVRTCPLGLALTFFGVAKKRNVWTCRSPLRFSQKVTLKSTFSRSVRTIAGVCLACGWSPFGFWTFGLFALCFPSGVFSFTVLLLVFHPDTHCLGQQMALILFSGRSQPAAGANTHVSASSAKPADGVSTL